jgi:hypothetical protein
MATTVAVVGALAGAYSANRQAKAAKQAANSKWESTSEPWGPTRDARIGGVNAANELWQNYNNSWKQGPQFGSAATNGAAATGTGGGGKKRKGKGGGGGGRQQGISGQMAGALRDRANAGHELYAPANQAATGLLAGQNELRDEGANMMRGFGQEGFNPYLDEAGQRFDEYENPYLKRFIEEELGFGDGSGGGGSRSSSYRYGGGGGGGVGGGGGSDANLVGAQKYLKDALDADPYAADNPAMQKMIDSASRRMREEYMETVVPGITSEWAGVGRYGGGLYADAQAQATGRFTNSLGDMIGSAEFQAYQDAMQRRQENLGLATSYDLGAMNDATQRAGMRSSGRASAAAAQAAADRDRQQMLFQAIGAYGDDQRFGAEGLMGAAGLLNNAQQFGSSGIMGAADMFSRDQLGALGLIPSITGMDVRDMEAAFGAGNAMDQTGIQRGSLGIQRQGLNLQAQQQRWAQDRANRAEPFEMLGRAGELYNTFGGGYGTQSGYGQGGYNPGPGAAGGAMSGAMAGLGIANAMGYGYGGGGGGYGGNNYGQPSSTGWGYNPVTGARDTGNEGWY